MANELEYRNELRRVTNEWENDNTEPNTKRVLMYGWDDSASAKVRVAVDSSGYLKVVV
jgi:hypothetical protein